jgi:alpha-L-fucosidase
MTLPTPQQVEWQDCELGMFYHFDIPIYKPGWDWRSWKDLPPAEQYNPEKLSTDQWLEAARAIGARYAVFVAQHCSGFCQWQTDIYPYGVKQSPWRNGKGDVVADFVESCLKYGIKPGLYASVTANGYLEVDNPGLVNRGQGGDPEAQERYRQICEQMLDELWGNYGKLFEVWFDGGALPVDQGGPDMLPLLSKHQPDAMVFQGPAATIRWIGNERGVAPYPCWATVPAESDYNGPGIPGGEKWLPGECDVPVRNHEWFWTPDDEHKLYPLDELVDMYYQSVGHNCNMLLNANPGPDGLIPEADFQRYVEFGAEIRRRFEEPIVETQGTGDLLELSLPTPQRIDHVAIMEDIVQGERVRQFEVEGKVGPDRWTQLCTGFSIGHKCIQHFDPVEVAAVRLHIAESVAEPQIRRFSLFHAGYRSSDSHTGD